MEITCMSTDKLANFLTYLSESAITLGENKVTISGVYEWVYIESFNMWAIDGNFMECIRTVGFMT